MPNLNKIMIIGHIGQDPIIRVAQNGTRFAHLSVATTRYWPDKNSQSGFNSETFWHSVSLSGYFVDKVDGKAEKGDTVYVEGYLHMDIWKDNNGVEHKNVTIRADDFLLLHKKSDTQQRQPQPQQPPQPQPQQPQGPQQGAIDFPYGDNAPGKKAPWE